MSDLGKYAQHAVGKPSEDRCVGEGSIRYVWMQAASDVWLYDTNNDPTRISRTVVTSDCDKPARRDTADPAMTHKLWK